MTSERWEVVSAEQIDGPFDTLKAAGEALREHARTLVQRELAPEYGVRIAQRAVSVKPRGEIESWYVVEVVKSRRVS